VFVSLHVTLYSAIQHLCCNYVNKTQFSSVQFMAAAFLFLFDDAHCCRVTSNFHILPRDARNAKRGIVIVGRPSARPSVCPSVCKVEVL